jgi:hypothetical protein
MLEDLYVLRNGLPIYINKSNETDVSSKAARDLNDDKITMISGFFSAISSFATTVGNFGEMREIKMTNDIKFSFYKPHNNENLLFVGSSKANKNQQMIESLLNKISSEFVQKYPFLNDTRWNGQTEMFDSFTGILNKIIKESNYQLEDFQEATVESQKPRKEIQSLVLSKVESSRIMKNLENMDNRMTNLIGAQKISDENARDFQDNSIVFEKIKNETCLPYSKEVFYNMVPIKRTEQQIQISDMFSGEDSKKVFRCVDGRNNIDSISKLVNLPNERVFNLCKCFIKMGLVSFTN